MLVQLDKSSSTDRQYRHIFMTTHWEGYFIFKHFMTEISSKINQQVYNIIQGLFIFLHRSSTVYSAPAGDKQIAVEPQHSLHRTQYYQTVFQWKRVTEQKGELSCFKYPPEKI